MGKGSLLSEWRKYAGTEKCAIIKCAKVKGSLKVLFFINRLGNRIRSYSRFSG